MTGVVILTNCKRFNIPTNIVRSKADQHIRNLMRDMGYDSDDDDVEDILEDANMLDQKNYTFPNGIRRGDVKEKQSKKPPTSLRS
ncbi:hypothetical protein M405DRAFT_869747 [Rhizopogon salebrosus TDB-379]|nr:hypothetical protein M405DRAFT_869747 [Rhizopogon salebrosus TDB-379]